MQAIGEKVLAWLDPVQDQLEDAARQQLLNIARLPFVFRHVAVMPDCHVGKGATVGSVIATKGAIIPAAVGVDIGCGMVAVKTTLAVNDLPDTLAPLRRAIEGRIPLGAGAYNRDVSHSAAGRMGELIHLAEARSSVKHYDGVDPRWRDQLGTLGSGNHFIEVCLDQQDRVWVVLHSGSRGIGNKLAQKHIKVAQRLMDDFFVRLEDPDLAYLPEKLPEFGSYIRDLLWAQDFARLNRDEMMDRVMDEVRIAFRRVGHGLESERINCHHNFTQKEHHFGQDVWVTRKGAIQMRPGQLGVIPGSMGTRSYIVSGLGNPLSFHSAPHGAGRRFSRGEARRRFTMEDYDRQMAGVECRRSEALIDELPGAYKDIDRVMENSKDLVTVVATLRQVMNVKGD